MDRLALLNRYLFLHQGFVYCGVVGILFGNTAYWVNKLGLSIGITVSLLMISIICKIGCIFIEKMDD